MIVYKLRSGDRWYGTHSEFNTEEEDSPIFLNTKRIAKLIRDEIKNNQQRATDWGETQPGDGNRGWWMYRLDDWKVVEVVEYELVQKGVVELAR